MAELTLEVVEGPGAGTQVQLSGPLVVGRSEAVAFKVHDELVSREHARIAPYNGGAVVEDLGSTNGTFVNGNGIHGPTRIDPGDQVQVGTTVIELRSAQQVVDQPSAVRPIPPGLALPPQPPNYIPPDLGLPGTKEGPLEALLDVRTKARARFAPLAVFALAILAVVIYLAVR